MLLVSRRGLAAFTARLAHARAARDRGDAPADGCDAEGGRTAGDADSRRSRQRLEAHDLPRRLASIHGRLTGVRREWPRPPAGDATAPTPSSARWPARLESLSPLAVLARGYAVCWNADRSAIVRSADRSAKVTLSA